MLPGRRTALLQSCSRPSITKSRIERLLTWVTTSGDRCRCGWTLPHQVIQQGRCFTSCPLIKPPTLASGIQLQAGDQRFSCVQRAELLVYAGDGGAGLHPLGAADLNLGGARSPGLTGVRAVAQTRRANPGEPARTTVNCDPGSSWDRRGSANDRCMTGDMSERPVLVDLGAFSKARD